MSRNRTICLKVAEVMEGGTKSEFYADLRRSLDYAMRSANLAISACVRLDNFSSDKMPRGEGAGMSVENQAYHAAKEAMPDGAKGLTSGISRNAVKSYKTDRWHVIRGRKSVRLHRTHPWPLLHNKSSKTMKIEDAGEYITATVKLAGGWWKVKVAGGSSYREQLAGVRFALDNDGIRDSKIWTDRKHKAIIGVSVELPELQTTANREATLEVCTSRDNLIVATKARSDVPFVITGDKVQRWINERDRVYQRLRQDAKSGKRRPLQSALRRVGDKWKRRMDSYTHEVASQLVAHAKRRKCGTIRFDATIKSFANLPWFELAAKIKYKCDDAGIDFVEATQQVAEPDVDRPHVYFKYSPSTNRVKIGKTGRTDGGRHGSETDSAEDLVVLAVDNQPKTKLTQREKHFHAYFAEHRQKGEWFAGEPIIHFLREAGWLGNAGNSSQIAQVLPMQGFASETASSGPECERYQVERLGRCSQRRLTSEDICVSNATALAVTKSRLGN